MATPSWDQIHIPLRYDVYICTGEWYPPVDRPFPEFELFPSIARLERALWRARHRVIAAVTRVGAAFGVLRHGLPECDDW